MPPNNATMGERALILHRIEFPIFLTVVVLQIVVGSLANIAVITIFFVRRELLSWPSDLLVLNLSCTDLLCCVSILPWMLNILIQKKFDNARFFYFASLNIFMISCCVNAVIAVTVDRFIAVTYNLRYRVIMTKCKTYNIIVFSWLWALACSIGSFISYNLEHYKKWYENFVWFQHILGLVLVLLMYVAIFKVAWTQAQSISAQTKYAHGFFERAHYRLMTKTICNSFGIVCLCYASFLPFLVYDIVVSTADIRIPRDQENTMLFRFFCFNFISCCINPFIYVFRRQRYRPQRYSGVDLL